ncbi:tRNA(His) guanylyltransferase Thg1 family protein [Actinomadura coerulea]|uniref:tRNA(His) guanylyltransferase Thg1 family protein n=1 Tax=Actinomadura coerulea TaxID=46159 RepID=UPI0034182E9F
MKDLEARMRAREYFHSLTLLPGAWAVVRVDGRSFSRFTEANFDKPFDRRFSDLMVDTATTLLTELGGRYAYTQSDEISVVLDPDFDLFGREVEKLVSLSAGIATAAFTHAAGQPAVFDARVWMGASVDDVDGYMTWRRTNAAHCALNTLCYWTLRKEGLSARRASRELEGTSADERVGLLSARGIDFNDVPHWQRHGIALWWETYEKTGHDPIRDTYVTTTRRRIRVERDQSMTSTYRELLEVLQRPTA